MWEKEESVCVQNGTDRKELKKAIHKLKCSKAAGIDGITVKMLKYEWETEIEWMFICGFAWRQSGRMKLVCPYLHKGFRRERCIRDYRSIDRNVLNTILFIKDSSDCRQWLDYKLVNVFDNEHKNWILKVNVNKCKIKMSKSIETKLVDFDCQCGLIIESIRVRMSYLAKWRMNGRSTYMRSGILVWSCGKNKSLFDASVAMDYESN